MSHYPDWERQGDGLVFRGTHYLVISKKRDGMKAVRSAMDEVFNPFIAAFGEQERQGAGSDEGEVEGRPPIVGGGSSSSSSGSALVNALPPNVGLMTLMQLVDGKSRHDDDRRPWEEVSNAVRPESKRNGGLILLVRLAHRYAKGEDEALSQPATVDLSQIVVGYSLRDAEEIALTGGGSLKARAQRLSWTATPGGTSAAAAAAAAAAEEEDGGDDDDGGGSGESLATASGDDDDWKVTLGPMEIKTYRLELR